MHIAHGKCWKRYPRSRDLAQPAIKPATAAAWKPSPGGCQWGAHGRYTLACFATASPARSKSNNDSTSNTEDAAPPARWPSPHIVSVDGLVVQPAYRSTPWAAEARRATAAVNKAVVMFVSESGICRGPLAAAAFTQLLEQSPLKEWVEVEMRATRDYCEGQQPDAAAVAAATTLGFGLSHHAAAAGAEASASSESAAAAAQDESSPSITVPAQQGVRVFHPSEDIVTADLVLVMDKYTAADVLREVSAYDLINPGGRYSSRVRMLGSYHPWLSSQITASDGQDIDDALYGNDGDDQQSTTALQAAQLIVESCRNLLQHLEDLACSAGLMGEHQAAQARNSGSSSSGSLEKAESMGTAADVTAGGVDGGGASEKGGAEKFKAVLAHHVQQEGVMDWLVPPMLQGSNADVDGWV